MEKDLVSNFPRKTVKVAKRIQKLRLFNLIRERQFKTKYKTNFRTLLDLNFSSGNNKTPKFGLLDFPHIRLLDFHYSHPAVKNQQQFMSQATSKTQMNSTSNN